MAYNALDRGHTLEILAGYNVDPQIYQLLNQYWERDTMAEREIKYYRDPLRGF